MWADPRHAFWLGLFFGAASYRFLVDYGPVALLVVIPFMSFGVFCVHSSMMKLRKLNDGVQ